MLHLALPPQNILEALMLFFALAIGHALADFPLQGEFLATHKNRHFQPAQGEDLPPGLWFHCLLAHCLIHAGSVWLFTGQVLFAAIELVIHFVLDFLKCEGKTTFNQDQVLHYLCKAAYVLVFWSGWLT